MEFKETANGSVPPNWDEKKLEDIAVLINGKAFKESEWSNQGLPIVRIQNLKDKSASFNYYCGKVEDQFLIECGDLLFSWSGSRGTSFGPHFWWGDNAVLNQHIFKVRIKSTVKIDKEFLYYYLLEITKNIEDLTYGLAALVHIRKKDLENISIILPPLPEQRAIARALRAVQDAREARLREIALERERKAALMEHLFTHGTRGEAMKQTEIGEMPESWNVNSCELICKKITVGVVVRPSSYYVPSGVPAFRSFNIREDRIVPNDLVYFSHEDNDTILSKSKIKTGDVLIVRTGYPGTASVVPDEFDGANCIDLVIARPNQSLIKSEYLSRYLNSSEGKRQALASEIGLAQKHLNVGAVNRMRVPLPIIEEQCEIAGILKACDSKIVALENEARLHEELFRAMLEELMTGRLPAGALAETEVK